jgi:hypothetical protein
MFYMHVNACKNMHVLHEQTCMILQNCMISQNMHDFTKHACFYMHVFTCMFLHACFTCMSDFKGGIKFDTKPPNKLLGLDFESFDMHVLHEQTCFACFT